MIENYMEKIHAYIDDNRNDMIKDWEILVRMEGHFEEVKNVQKWDLNAMLKMWGMAGPAPWSASGAKTAPANQ